jgi:putative phosphoribosyl transferase
MEKLIHIPAGQVSMEGMLSIPEKSKGLVLFAHGSGSSRLSPRNTFVAKNLQKAGLSTLLIDLLSEEEDSVYETRFNIPLLKDRLKQIVQWLQKEPGTKDLPIGLFGASTGAASALEVAAELKKNIKAVVSRGGRPDLAMPVLPEVVSPTLLIVGGQDFQVIELNGKAFAELRCTKLFEIVPNATHLFEEPGCLEEVSKLAREWFLKYLTKNA